MDSITQAALGAAVGEGVLGRRIGNRAPIWGAVLGTLPDLDVVFNGMMNEIEQLSWHRGPSHSILFALVAAPALGYLLRRIHHTYEVPLRSWSIFVFLTIVTHPLLDTLTNYGTQLFWPFTSWPAAWPTISIVDPLYTIPLLVGVIGAMVVRDPVRSGRWNGWGLKLATGYLALTAVNKVIVEYQFREALDARQIPYERVMTTPSFFNNLMWHGLAANDDTVWSGIISHLDGDHPIVLQSVAKRRDLLAGIDTSDAVRKLLWFSQGFYRVTRRGGELHFDDLHVGRQDAHAGEADADASVFSFHILRQTDEGRVGFRARRATEPEDFGEGLDRFVDRVLGRPYAWEIRQRRAMIRD